MLLLGLLIRVEIINRKLILSTLHYLVNGRIKELLEPVSIAAIRKPHFEVNVKRGRLANSLKQNQ